MYGLYTPVMQVASLCWYDAIRIAVVYWSSSIVSRSLAMASTFALLGISVHTMGILISVGMMASIPCVRVNSDTPVDFRLIVL